LAFSSIWAAQMSFSTIDTLTNVKVHWCRKEPHFDAICVYVYIACFLRWNEDFPFRISLVCSIQPWVPLRTFLCGKRTCKSPRRARRRSSNEVEEGPRSVLGSRNRRLGPARYARTPGRTAPAKSIQQFSRFNNTVGH